MADCSDDRRANTEGDEEEESLPLLTGCSRLGGTLDDALKDDNTESLALVEDVCWENLDSE